MAKPLSREEMFRGLTRFSEKENLRDLCILEVEGGVVVQGNALIDTKAGFGVALRTRTLTHDQLRELARS